jgi:membrane-associated phospholipid phosphatase
MLAGLALLAVLSLRLPQLLPWALALLVTSLALDDGAHVLSDLLCWALASAFETRTPGYLGSVVSDSLAGRLR